MIRKGIFHTENALRPLFVSVLGRIVLRVYIALNNEEVDLEGVIQVESSRGAKRIILSINAYTHLHIHTYIHTYNSLKYTYIQTHIHTYIHTYNSLKYIYIQTHIHTHIHTYIHNINT
jgi:hypothetical protein